MAHIDYRLTVLSPFTHLAGDRMDRGARAHGATVSYRPDIMVPEPPMDAAFDAMTAEGMARGIFGAPFYIVGDRRFWGQDRISHLDAHLIAKP